MKKLKVLACVLILALLCACSLGKASSPSSRVLESMDAVKEGKLEDFRAFALTTDAASVNQMYELLSKTFLMNGGVKTIDVESETIEGDKATVKIWWRWKNGQSVADHIRLRKQDGIWMLDF